MPGIHNGIGTTFRNAAFGGGGTPPNPNFISTWDTTQAGSASDTIVLPMTAGVATVDWGDGTIDTTNTHTYAAGGTYTVTIIGSVTGFLFNNGGDKKKITDISNWGGFDIDAKFMFWGCSNLDITATDYPIISTTDISRLFLDCVSLTTPDFSSWDVSSVTNMNSMFRNATSFNQDIGSWDVSSVTDMSSMFSGAGSFNQNIGNWNVSSVIYINSVFYGATSFNQNISSWDVSNVTNMNSMFNGATSFNQPIGIWDVSNVANFSSLFYGASAFDHPLNAWDTSSAFSMLRTFRDTTYNHPLDNWNTSGVTRMDLMFGNADDFDQDISSWDINQVTNFGGFMQSATGLSTANYDDLLIAWDAQGAMSYSGTVNFGSSQYSCRAEAARTSLISKWGGITDGGLNTSINCNFVSTWDTTQAGSASDTIVLPMTAGPTVDWGDGTINTANTHTYAAGGTYTITISGTINTFRFANAGDRRKITDVSNWGTFEIANTRTFIGCSNLNISATDAPIISTTSLAYTFSGCSVFNSDISNWDVSGVEIFGESTNNSGCFETCYLFDKPLSTWDMSNATNTRRMFAYCHNFNQDLSTWDTSNITDMFVMFWRNYLFDQDISSWVVGQVTDFGYFMQDVTLSTANYDALLIGWDAQGAMSFSGTANFGTSQYTSGGAAEAARTSLIAKWGGITDGGAA